MIFKILCSDINKKTKFKTGKSFIEALSYNEELFGYNLIKDSENLTMTDYLKDISVKIEEITINKLPITFILEVEGNYENIEPLRIKIISHLKDLGFDYITILSDDVSKKILLEIFSNIIKIENLIKEFITKFLIIKEQRVINFINFEALGQIFYKKVYLNNQDIIQIINEASDLESLKKKIDEAYPLKDFFGKTNFLQKWESLSEIRNMLLQKNYLFQKDLDTTNHLITELEEIVQKAENQL